MNTLIRKAIEAHEEATEAYAFKGSHPPNKWREIEEAFRTSRQNLEQCIDQAIERAFKNGQADVQSRHDYPDYTGS